MGYLRRSCENCRRMIYLKCDSDGYWRPYESWVAKTVDEGEWVLHSCKASNSPPRRAKPNPASAPSTTPDHSGLLELARAWHKLPASTQADVLALVRAAQTAASSSQPNFIIEYL